MNEARKRLAEDFAREVTKDPVLSEGLKALCEALEWSAFERWRQTDSGEGWRKLEGELAAIRGLWVTIRTFGGGDGGDK